MRLILFLSGLIIAVGTVSGTNTSKTPDFPEIRIYIAKGEYLSLRRESGEKMRLSKPVMLLNNDTAKVKEIHARGNNSLNFQRKSLSVELDKAIKIRSGGEKISLKKFNLLNLVMDKNLWHNRWADLNLEKIGLLPLFNTYCKLWINDEPQGFFLLIEKPQQSRGKMDSPYMLRRGPGHSISDEYFDDKDKDLAKKYRKQFNSIYSSIHSLSGDVLATKLQELINLETYYHYLAFNYLILNGDYADEVFFIIEPKSQQFEVIAWDYDDILRSEPHEGRAERNRRFVDKKLFSLEESLDVAIAGNAQLYSLYERSMNNMLGTLDSVYLSSTAFQVINELEQLSKDQSMAAVTLFLDKQPFDFNVARQDILYSLDLILKRRKWILGELKSLQVN